MKSLILSKPWPYLALLTAHIIWGINFVVAKITLTDVPTNSLAFLRFFLAALLILPFVLTLTGDRKRSLDLADLPRIFLTGLFLVTINIAFFYQGIVRATAIDSSALTMIIPIVSVLGGWWFLKEKIYWINLVGVFLSLIGVILVIGLPLLIFGTITQVNLLGDILIIISSISYVAGSLLSKSIIQKYHPILFTFYLFIVGAVTFFIPAMFEFIKDPNWIFDLRIISVLGILFIVFLSSLAAFFLLNYGVEKVGVSQANIFHYIEPAVAATVAAPLLGERISFSFIIGSSLIMLGVYWGTLGRQQHQHSHFKSHRS